MVREHPQPMPLLQEQVSHRTGVFGYIRHILSNIISITCVQNSLLLASSIKKPLPSTFTTTVITESTAISPKIGSRIDPNRSAILVPLTLREVPRDTETNNAFSNIPRFSPFHCSNFHHFFFPKVSPVSPVLEFRAFRT